jgi:molybdopterin synthase catalytic subunit
MDFHSFKESNPEVRNLNRDIQNLRYEHYEKLRQDTLKAVKEERNKIVLEHKSIVLGDSKHIVHIY